MKVFPTIVSLKENYKNIVVALGTFDGVHAGHQHIIRKAVSLAKTIGGTSVVFTFANHPLSIIRPNDCPPLIADAHSKEKWIGELGVDVMLHVPFTVDLLRLPPIAFIKLLKKYINPSYIIVGPNFSFGSGGRGTPEMLRRMEKIFDYQTIVHPLVQKGQKTVSSTRIRRLVCAGDVQEANQLLERRFSIRGAVVKGDQRGRLLGFPTANLDIDVYHLAPANGVYAAAAAHREHTYGAVVNVGVNPTFNGIKRHIEAHLLDFSGNLYGERIEIFFLERIRAEKRFETMKDLVEQIQKDAGRARQICGLLSA